MSSSRLVRPLESATTVVHSRLLRLPLLILTLTGFSACPDKSPTSLNHDRDEVQVTPKEATVSVGQTVDLAASVMVVPGGYTVAGPDKDYGWKWVIPSSGIVRLVKSTYGRATVEAVFEGDANVLVSVPGAGATLATIHIVRPTPQVASIVMNPSSAQFEVGETQNLVCTAFDASGKQLSDIPFIWSTSEAGVATANVGIVTAVSPGTATITCRTSGSSAQASAVVTVHPYELTIAPTSSTVPVGGSANLDLTIKNFRGQARNLGNRTLTWESALTSRVTVAPDPSRDYPQRGVARGVSEGPSVSVTATLSGAGGGKAVAQVAVRAVTATDFVGTHTKVGTREGAACTPPVFPSGSFSASLTVQPGSEGNLGIIMLEGHGTFTLQYSQFTLIAIPGGARLVSGAPIRVINGISYETQLTIEMVNGQITGTETFKNVSTGCTETYKINR
jgi:hypothetical protein